MTKDAIQPSEATVRPRYLVIGTDSEGCDHVYRTIDETVFVVDETTLVWRQDIAPGEVNDWIDYIDETRGWTDKQLFRSFYEALFSQLQVSDDDGSVLTESQP